MDLWHSEQSQLLQCVTRYLFRFLRGQFFFPKSCLAAELWCKIRMEARGNWTEIKSTYGQTNLEICRAKKRTNIHFSGPGCYLTSKVSDVSPFGLADFDMLWSPEKSGWEYAEINSTKICKHERIVGTWILIAWSQHFSKTTSTSTDLCFPYVPRNEKLGRLLNLLSCKVPLSLASLALWRKLDITPMRRQKDLWRPHHCCFPQLWKLLLDKASSQHLRRTKMTDMISTHRTANRVIIFSWFAILWPRFRCGCPSEC